MSMFQVIVHLALTAAPIATNAIWPREIWPAHPDSTTSDNPITANTAMAVALMIWSVRNSSGTSTNPTRIAVAVPQRRRRTRGSRATQGLSGRTSSARRQAAASSRSARPYWRRCRRSATSTAAPMIGVTSSGLLAFHDTPYSRMPSATAAVATVGRCRRRPMTSAASASTSVDRLSAAPSGTPRMPARRNSARKDSPAAIAQTSVESQATGMPSISARSLRSAEPRMAVPSRVVPRKTATAIMASGATISAIRSLADRMNVPIVTFQSTGGGMRCEAALLSHICGTSRASTASSCVMPMVATVSTRREAFENRRTKANSTIAPSATAATRPTPNPNR